MDIIFSLKTVQKQTVVKFDLGAIDISILALFLKVIFKTLVNKSQTKGNGFPLVWSWTLEATWNILGFP